MHALAATTALDAVDACIGADLYYGDGEYSTAFGGRSDAPTFGPFDPLRPDETLLPDGKLDAGDVPLPSALVEVRIAPNSGSATDIGGVGSLAILQPGNDYIGVYKCIPYSRDHKCTSNTGRTRTRSRRSRARRSARRRTTTTRRSTAAGSRRRSPPSARASIRRVLAARGLRQRRAADREQLPRLPRLGAVRLLAVRGRPVLRRGRPDEVPAAYK